MKNSFEDLYIDIKNNTSPEFENAWAQANKERKKSNIISAIIAIIVDCFLLLKFFQYINRQSLTFLFSLIPIFIIDLFIYVIINLIFRKNRNLYYGLYKENVITKLLHNFYDNLDYIPKKGMSSNIYNQGNYEHYDNYYSDDYMEGLLNNKYNIKMAEIKTEEEYTTTDSEGHTQTHTRTLFHGLFAKIQMDKSINSDLLIRENGHFSKKIRLDMDSDEFEKLFDVSASNQIIGMQLLTHDIMELLISFKKATGIAYDISIYDNILYLRFHTGSVFEAISIKKNAFDEKSLRKYYNILDFTYTLSKLLIDLIEKTEI